MSRSFTEEIEVLQAMLSQYSPAGDETVPDVSTLLADASALQQRALFLLSETWSVFWRSGSGPDGLVQDIECQLEYLHQFDAIAADRERYDKVQQQKQENAFNLVSHLPPSGFTRTSTALHTAAGGIVDAARRLFGDRQVRASVWAFRHDGCTMLSCDLFCDDDDSLNMPVTVTAEGEANFSVLDEPTVYDLTEALHLAGLIIRALGAKVVLGLGKNESNPAVLARPLAEGETNGPINLWSLTTGTDDE
ncbi:hypothetical protein EHW65_18215 [Erwinia psidii]|uniref:hypothetical protein n=1 Tax=Erwinia psidii TaxID=69224 RepID=UPI00226B393B|nr:hypothetical protein [Erwinia psidii]MCX8959095.1 hypothetical protein [Erwinia psidii]